jgi:acetyl-CoA C-acetyltransferase
VVAVGTNGTPVLVGIGQYSERFGEHGYQALTPVAIAERAARLALDDAGIAVSEIDVLACTRQFDESVPGFPSALGSPDNFPHAVAKRLGAEPARYIYAVTGGQSPQELVTELAGSVASGKTRVAVAIAAEAISTVLHMARSVDKPDLSEFTGPVHSDSVDEDRGVGLTGILAGTQVAHQLTDAPTQYAIFENARRARLGQTRAEQAAEMGSWFAPFTEVAAANPHADVRTAATAEELLRVTESNRMIADPYPKSVVAREKVNQSAAVLITSEEVAEELGIPRSQWVYLHGHSDLRDRELTHRQDLSRSEPAVLAVNASLKMAGVSLDQISAFDLYSCFPIAVSAVASDLGLLPEDPRRLTLTGGLPFFGGPGNGYSMHGIVEVVDRCRRDPQAWGLVGANGGMFSKYSVGIYSATPGHWHVGNDAVLQAELNAPPSVPVTLHPEGPATVETWTVRFEGGSPRAVVIGRLATGERFVANDFAEDPDVRELLLGEDGPGALLYVRSLPEGNRVTLGEARMNQLATPRPVGLQDEYLFLAVTATDGVLEVAVTGTDAAGALSPLAHHELAGVFDAFEADPELRVAILTGPDGLWTDQLSLPALTLGQVIPTTGLAGLTARILTKPVIAALCGDTTGTAFEVMLACTLVVAEAQISLGLAQVGAGKIPAAGGLLRVVERLPIAVANRLALSSRLLTAAAAERRGLVNEVAPTGAGLAVARELAAEIIDGPPLAIAKAMAVLVQARSGEVDLADQAAVEALDALLVTTDAAEAYAARLEGRAPVWGGN